MELTDRQQKAVAALLSARNVGDAARAAGIGRRTLTRWLADDVFRAALLTAEGQAIDAATRRLLGLTDGAVSVLEAAMTDQDASHSVKLRAAQIVLESLLKLRELRNVEERLAALEATIGQRAS